METNDGIAISPPHTTQYLGASPTSSTSGLFLGYNTVEDEPELYSASDDDEDAEMSDGGVQIDISGTHAEQLSTEMDMVDAEVMGQYTDSTLHTGAVQHDGALDYFGFTTIITLGGNNAESEYDNADNDGDEEDEDEGFIQQLVHASDPMSAVSQQLQNIQDGQEQDEMISSDLLHGTVQNHSTDPFPSLPLILEPVGDQDNLPALEVVPWTAHHSTAPAATAGSLLGVNIAGQGVDHAPISSDVDWAAEWDSDGEGDEEDIAQANALQVDDTHNLALRDFLYAWVRWGTNQKLNQKKKKKKEVVPNFAYLNKLVLESPVKTHCSDLRGDAQDFQGLDWTQIGVERMEARKMRLRTYKNYTNLKLPAWHVSLGEIFWFENYANYLKNFTLTRAIVQDRENYFKFRRMDFKPKIGLSHFQLRNLLACTSRSKICYAGEESKVYTINPLFDQEAVRMDLTDTAVQTANSITFNGIQISTIAADHNVLVAGGFAGEYGMIALGSPLRTDHIEGLITNDPNPITNHVQIHLNRHSGLPQAIFASNDTNLRTLDCTTNTIVAQHKFDYAMNCSAISPDHRLRVIVGDNRNVIISDAEKGEVLQDLSGHFDFGFACAWADNGWHVATGNQDKLIKIWDARNWTDKQGIGRPLKTISTAITGARSLKFSPLGSGKRVLVAAEAADMVSVIDAETYDSKQTLDFFGEICGIDFTPDGQSLFIGIHDSLRGGIMEFERCVSGGSYVAKESYGMEFDERASGLDWKRTDAEVVDDPRSMRTAAHRQRKAAQSWEIDPF